MAKVHGKGDDRAKIKVQLNQSKLGTISVNVKH